MGLYLASSVLRGGSMWDLILGAGFAAAAGCSGHAYIQQLRERRPLATLSSEGVTSENGRSFDWPRISKIYKFTGVLFIRDDSKFSAWIVRLDPAEVGGKQ